MRAFTYLDAMEKAYYIYLFHVHDEEDKEYRQYVKFRERLIQTIEHLEKRIKFYEDQLTESERNASDGHGEDRNKS